MSAYPRVASLKTVEAFRARLRELNLELPCDDAIIPAPDSPMAQPIEVDGFPVGNRWVIHPMEGWDAETDGRPSDLVRRRWNHFAISGAKWIWGGEAMAVIPEARANPNQLVINESTRDSLARLMEETLTAHRYAFGSTDDLLIGFQLTHSGRFSKPVDKKRLEPRIAYHHPVLDRRFGVSPDRPIVTDEEIDRIIEHFIAAARIAEFCGAQFVDVKHCHGYFGHELLTAFTRPGKYGGPLENRTRYLRHIVAGIRAATKLKIGVRFSAFDFVAYKPDPALSTPRKLGPGIPEDPAGVTAVDLSLAMEFLQVLTDLGIKMVNLTAGSPYYNPHIQRPALFPPSDGYQPPEDPLVGCVRQIQAHADLKHRFPNLVTVGTAYTYFQDYLPHVAQAIIRRGDIDTVGIGRMVLSYPTLPADSLKGILNKKLICRTFSDCTTGPRNGLVSGCYPLDPFYRTVPDYRTLAGIKQGTTL
ncbi:MAG: NADH:flavin oxidoreductase [Bryobacterales bacterium]|nr:NADH:flavin oxidoreductase [Bryobacterales bacterium]